MRVALEPAHHEDDLRLASACLRGDKVALGQLEMRAQIAARKAFAGKRLSTEDERDVVQNVLTHLLVATPGATARLASYTGAGPLDGWLRVTLTRAGISRIRVLATEGRAGLGSRPDDEEAAAVVRALDDDPELAALRSRYSGALAGTLKESLAALDDENRTLIREHYLEGLSIDALAARYQTHRATAARRLARARATPCSRGRARG